MCTDYKEIEREREKERDSHSAVATAGSTSGGSADREREREMDSIDSLLLGVDFEQLSQTLSLYNGFLDGLSRVNIDAAPSESALQALMTANKQLREIRYTARVLSNQDLSHQSPLSIVEGREKGDEERNESDLEKMQIYLSRLAAAVKREYFDEFQPIRVDPTDFDVSYEDPTHITYPLSLSLSLSLPLSLSLSFTVCFLLVIYISFPFSHLPFPLSSSHTPPLLSMQI